MDVPTIVLSGVVSLAAGGVAAGAAVYVSSGERKAALNRDEKQRAAQWELFGATLRRAEAERFETDTNCWKPSSPNCSSTSRSQAG